MERSLPASIFCENGFARGVIFAGEKNKISIKKQKVNDRGLGVTVKERKKKSILN